MHRRSFLGAFGAATAAIATGQSPSTKQTPKEAVDNAFKEDAIPGACACTAYVAGECDPECYHWHYGRDKRDGDPCPNCGVRKQKVHGEYICPNGTCKLGASRSFPGLWYDPGPVSTWEELDVNIHHD